MKFAGIFQDDADFADIMLDLKLAREVGLDIYCFI